MLMQLVTEHVYRAKMNHEREHPYFSSGPKIAKYDLKDTFFR